MNADELKQLLNRVSSVKIAVIGDFCLDAYWFLDMSRSEVSVETGRATQPVESQRYTLGGAGNVVNNLLSLGAADVHALGVVGQDPFGHEMLRILQDRGVQTDGLLMQPSSWNTHVYSKPYVDDIEQSRLDFGNYNELAEDTGRRLLEQLEAALSDVDVVIINQQVASGIHASESFRAALQQCIKKHSGTTFLLDSRHFSDAYAGTIRKINDVEAAVLHGLDKQPDDVVLHSEACQSAKALQERWEMPLFVTRGARGCVVADTDGLKEIPGLQMIGRVDTVGAGDSMLAGIAVALGAGASLPAAAELGNFTAGVTVQKLFETGTASQDEVLAMGSDPDYIYRPELAEDPRQARMLEGSEIEVVSEVPGKDTAFTHAIFDHDGTISTLRQGWEHIMEPMMIKAILGPEYQDADEALYHKVVQQSREFIDKTTGIQTITQMEGLVKMVRDFGCVPAEDVLDAPGYKKIYNDELMNMVRTRVQKYQNGELAVEDYTLKNAVPFLQHLHSKGLKLYLASGTDEQDVIDEAHALGYGELFEGRIYGAVGDSSKEAKKMVLDRILKDVGREHAGSLLTLGDGPVEIRETHKRGGYTVGIASDEVQRFGLNPEKRTRLIRAGADIVIPDFSQLSFILQQLRLT